jgi:glycosyltransferase involved in cell wall biosynthesis
MDHMSRVDISVVVVTHNRAAMLSRGLKTIVNQVTDDRFSYEVLVVDDGSTDNTAAVVQQAIENSDNHSLSLRYIHQVKSGIGSARNKGVMEARGRWIAFFDDDQLADPDWLAELYRVARTGGADCVDGQVNILFPAGFHPGPKVRAMFGEKFVKRDIKRKSPIDTLGTGNILINRYLFDKLGYFDVAYEVAEDADFFMRVAQGGFKICYAHKALIHHVIPESRLQISSIGKTFFKGGVARAQIHLKYYGRSKILTHMAWRLAVILERDIPLLVIGIPLRCQPLILDSLAGLSATAGYFWGGLRLLRPGLFGSVRG